MPVYAGTSAVSKIYHGSTLIANGYAATTQFFGQSAAVCETDPYWSSVKLLLPFDGPTLVDYSSQELAISTTGTISLDYTTKRYGQASLASATGSTHCLSFPGSTLEIGTNDFCIEAYFCRTGDLTNHVRFLVPANHVSGGNRLQFLMLRSTASTGRLYADIYGAVIAQSSVLTWDVNTWYHVAVTRTGSTLRLWRDGVQVASTTNTTSFNSDTEFKVCPGTSTVRIDDLRWTIGQGRYTATFTPPSKPHPTPIDPYCDNVGLLLPMDGTVGSTSFADESSHLHTITTYGNAAITATAKHGQAATFDGSGDYLTASGAALAVGTGAFTVEAWVRMASDPATNAYRGIANTMTSTTSASNSAWHFEIVNLSGTQYLQLGRHGGASVYARTPFAPTLNQWYHVAACRDASGNIYLFVDGVAQTVTTSGAAGWLASNFTTQLLAVGMVATPYYWHGQIDDFRLTVGVARYLSSFDPGHCPHPLCPYTS